MDELENIDEMVDEIIGDSGSPAGGTSSVACGDTFPRGEGRKTKLYKLACIMCGDVFEAKTPNASYCPACRAKARSEAGRKGAEKAHGLRTASAGERIAAAPAEPRNDELADASPHCHSEEQLPSCHSEERSDEESFERFFADAQDDKKRKAPVTRAAMLDMAKAIVGGEREKQYGSPEDSFWAIAAYWTVYLQQVGHLPEHRELTAEDTAIMMILLKVARQAGRGKLDNWVDIAGYAACGAEITAEVDDG